MRSLQKEEFASRCVGSDFNCCKPYEEVTASLSVLSFVLISLFYHDFDQALKSPRIIEKSDLKALTSCSIFPKFERK